MVLLGFVEPFKTVPEAAGTVQLCVELQAGELQLPVRVRVQSSDITAEGKLYVHIMIAEEYLFYLHAHFACSWVRLF